MITLELVGVWNVVLQFIIQMSLGIAYGYLIRKVSVWIINRIKLDYDGLYPVLIMAIVMFTYSITARLDMVMAFLQCM
jgi:potassium/hydrogen antiporter